MVCPAVTFPTDAARHITSLGKMQACLRGIVVVFECLLPWLDVSNPYWGSIQNPHLWCDFFCRSRPNLAEHFRSTSTSQHKGSSKKSYGKNPDGFLSVGCSHFFDFLLQISRNVRSLTYALIIIIFSFNSLRMRTRTTAVPTLGFSHCVMGWRSDCSML